MLKKFVLILCVVLSFFSHVVIAQKSMIPHGRLHEKVAIVIGASQGIGKATAMEFANQGAKVVLVSRNESALNQVKDEIQKQGGRAIYRVGDISVKEDMENVAKETMDKYGRIDILCQNAGIFPSARLEQMTDELWDKVIKTNLTGTYYAVQAVLPYMKEQAYGRIVLTSSISGPMVGLPGQAHYTASKAGMNGFMRTAAIELAKYNVTINSVMPGNILAEDFQATEPDKLELQRKAIPLGHLGQPRDVALALLFLASDEASFITGQSLIIDGGQVLPESHHLIY